LRRSGWYKVPLSARRLRATYSQNQRLKDNVQGIESEKRFVRLRVSHKGMRIIDKVGLDKVVADMRAQGQRV
jgi:hypothetical protein